MADDHGVTVAKCGAFARGTGVIQAPPLRVLETVQNTSRKSEWDEVFESVHLLKSSRDGQTRVEHHIYKVPKAASVLGVSKRDFCVLGRWVIQNDGTILVAVASTLPDEAVAHGCAPSKKYVRGTIHLGGFVIRALPPSMATKTGYIGSDVGGRSGVVEEPKRGSPEEPEGGAQEQSKLSDRFEAEPSAAERVAIAKATAWQKLMSASRCQITFVANVDLGGNIPSFVQKMVGLKQPQSIASLRKLVLSEDPINADRAAVFRDAFGRHDPIDQS